MPTVAKGGPLLVRIARFPDGYREHRPRHVNKGVTMTPTRAAHVAQYDSRIALELDVTRINPAPSRRTVRVGADEALNGP